MFQYSVARAYAESIGAEFRTPDWVGRKLFEGVHDKLMEGPALPNAHDEVLDGSTNLHLHGYYQKSEHVALLSRAKLKEWFRPKNPKQGHELVVHQRRGDYIQAGCYALVSDASYQVAMKSFGYNWDKAVIYSDANPVERQYDDFLEIMASKVIFRANSTYSWWAAALSDARVFAPVVEDRTNWIEADFVEGNHPRLCYMFKDLHIKP